MGCVYVYQVNHVVIRPQHREGAQEAYRGICPVVQKQIW